MRALVTGIKPYVARLDRLLPDGKAARFEAFAQIRTKREVMNASHFNGNTANYLVGEGAVEAVGREAGTFVDFDLLMERTADPAYLAAIKPEFDCVVFVAADLLGGDYDAAAEAQLLSRLDLPTVVLGIGFAARPGSPAQDAGGHAEISQVLRSREHHVFTRGSVTADYLRARGLQQVWPTGCPSMFRGWTISPRRSPICGGSTGVRASASPSAAISGAAARRSATSSSSATD